MLLILFQLGKIFNRNTVKVSYSCMPDVASIIKSHNKKVSTKKEEKAGKLCNCRKNTTCPLKGKCLTPSIIYKAEVKAANDDNAKVYIGLTELTFKKRYYIHQQSFRDKKHMYSTELSRHIWELKEKKKEYTITWSIAVKARAYDNGTKRCDLCLTEKLLIINADKKRLLNRRSELISKCRDQNNLAKFTCDIT